MWVAGVVGGVAERLRALRGQRLGRWRPRTAQPRAGRRSRGSRDDAHGQASADESLDLPGKLVFDLEVPCAFCDIDHEEQVGDKQGLQRGHP